MNRYENKISFLPNRFSSDFPPDFFAEKKHNNLTF